MKGKLIIIEAGDGCGKATQTELLYKALVAQGRQVMKVAYPDYQSEACMPVKMYLRGDFGGHADDVNAYAASVLFAVDRYASFRMKWKEAYEQGVIILADRYTTSNMVHQAVKLDDPMERNDFLNWLWDLEFVKMGLPTPDKVIFLDVPPQISAELIDQRSTQQQRAKDIHEQDQSYLAKCHRVYREMAERYHWLIIDCVDERTHTIKSVEAIHQDIMKSLDL